MARRHTLQDATGVMLHKPPLGAIMTVLAIAPTAGAVGYPTGSVWINTSGTIGLIFYVNTGTITSATWTAVT